MIPSLIINIMSIRQRLLKTLTEFQNSFICLIINKRTKDIITIETPLFQKRPAMMSSARYPMIINGLTTATKPHHQQKHSGSSSDDPLHHTTSGRSTTRTIHYHPASINRLTTDTSISLPRHRRDQRHYSPHQTTPVPFQALPIIVINRYGHYLR